MAYKSITKRWLFNSLGVIFIGLVVIEIVFGFAIKNFYYSSAKQAVLSSANAGNSVLQRMSENSKANLSGELRNLVENFKEKDRMEMMAIDHNDNIVVTSSGFSYITNVEMPDYTHAINSASGEGYYVGKLPGTNEKIMAITKVLTVVNNDFSAVRYVISIEEVDALIFKIMLGMTGVLILILGLVLLSGSYFIKSIVIPVRELGTVARGFATGDMSARIIRKSDDEIGELCDIINYMADEIQNTEKMKNEFISSVSHELRTPLTAIKGWGETLMTMNSQDVGMVKKGMHVIINETERLSNMVEELLDFSRIQNGRFTLVKTKMDILAELGEAVLVYTERARRDNMTLVYNEPENVPYVFGDKNRLRQVFINIIDNALKYSDSGDIVTVEVKEENSYIDIMVGDTGCGIATEDLPKVKEKFYKANSTRRGSGIGLAVANEIVQLHDGELYVESEIDVGTTVTIRLPVMQKRNEDRKAEITVQDERSTEIVE